MYALRVSEGVLQQSIQQRGEMQLQEHSKLLLNSPLTCCEIR